MTIIAAIRTTDSIRMGGDSAQNSNGSISIIQDPKIFLNGDYVLGVAGSPRLAGILQYEFRPPQKIQSMTWKEFLVRSFLPKLKAALGPESALETSSILVGTKGGGVFELNSNWFVEQSREPYAAIGSGASLCAGIVPFHVRQSRAALTQGDERSGAFERLCASAIHDFGTAAGRVRRSDVGKYCGAC